MRKNMLSSESDKVHVSDSCFPVDQLDNTLSLESFVFEQERLATASLRPVREMVPILAQSTGSTLLQAVSIQVSGKIWGVLGGACHLKQLCTKRSSQTADVVPRSGMEEFH